MCEICSKWKYRTNSFTIRVIGLGNSHIAFALDISNVVANSTVQEAAACQPPKCPISSLLRGDVLSRDSMCHVCVALALGNLMHFYFVGIEGALISVVPD